MPEFSKTHTSEWGDAQIEVLAIGPHDKAQGTGYTIEVSIFENGKQIGRPLKDSDQSYTTSEEAFDAGYLIGKSALDSRK